ncbi:hypothetical protein BC830DRAFT_1117675 [Chytriomyces sp. MP71]|nr:hypothetical protein BC830DRAFT_1117675 [Chytriomyces sp. MP71]
MEREEFRVRGGGFEQQPEFRGRAGTFDDRHDYRYGAMDPREEYRRPIGAPLDEYSRGGPPVGWDSPGPEREDYRRAAAPHSAGWEPQGPWNAPPPSQRYYDDLPPVRMGSAGPGSADPFYPPRADQYRGNLAREFGGTGHMQSPHSFRPGPQYGQDTPSHYPNVQRPLSSPSNNSGAPKRGYNESERDGEPHSPYRQQSFGHGSFPHPMYPQGSHGNMGPPASVGGGAGVVPPPPPPAKVPPPPPKLELSKLPETLKYTWNEREQAEFDKAQAERKRLFADDMAQRVELRRIRFETSMADWEVHKWERQVDLVRTQIDGLVGALVGL